MKKLFFLLLILNLSNIYTQDRWLKLNGPGGARITSIYVSGDTLIVSSGVDLVGVIFYSIDGGSNWIKSNYKFDRVNDFIKTNDGGIIAAADDHGLYKSFDLKNWFRLLDDGEEYCGLGKDHLGNLYAGIEAKRIYKSTDNGATWLLSGTGSGGRIWHFFLNTDSTLFCSSIGDILRKKNNSEIWEHIFLADKSFYTFSSGDSGFIYSNSTNSVYVSKDSGISWQNLDTNKFLNGNYLYNSLYNKRFIVCCDDGTGWFGTGYGIAVSDDNGLTWHWSNTGFPPKFGGVYLLAKSGDFTYATPISAGVYKSTDFGDSWFPINNGLNAANALTVNFDINGNLWAACWSNGIYKSTDSGLSWSVKHNGLTNVYIYSVVSDSSGVLLVATQEGTFRSTDDGENWVQVDDRFFAFLYKDDFNRIYGLGNGIGLYRTTDAGLTWQKIDKGFRSGYVYGFAVDKENKLYAGTDYGIIYKSTDDGVSWNEIYNSNNQNCLIMGMAVAPNGYIYATNLVDGVLRSTDNGITWVKKRSDYSYLVRNPIAVSKNGVIYTGGSNNKTYSSTDNGDTWTDVTDNLALTSVQDIKFDKDGNMFLATDESVWRSNPDYPVNVIDEIKPVLSYSLSQNYPNPFNPSTEIKYSIPAAGFVSIKVYDILGKEISSLLNEEKQSGEYTVSFNGSRYPSGVYFYTIRAGNFLQIKKLMLLK